MPAALAISVVGVPRKPRSAKADMPTSSTVSRRTSAVERVRLVEEAVGVMRSVSMHSLTADVKRSFAHRAVERPRDPRAVEQTGSAADLRWAGRRWGQRPVRVAGVEDELPRNGRRGRDKRHGGLAVAVLLLCGVDVARATVGPQGQLRHGTTVGDPHWTRRGAQARGGEIVQLVEDAGLGDERRARVA